MAEDMTTTTAPVAAAGGEAAVASQEAPASQSRPKPRGPPLNQIYSLPAPIRTYPLPSFYPSNPISLFHLVYTWVKQTLSPPPAEPAIVHQGIWDPNTRSVHIIEPKTVRALWEQGFYGKGSLSRSEPNWLKREQIRTGAVAGDVSEQRTASRREERRQVKWERARTEQEALERTRLEEALLATGPTATTDASQAGVRPLEPEVVPSGALNEPSSTLEPSGDSLDDDLSITVASQIFGYAKRSPLKMAEFDPEIDFPALPEFPAKASHGSDQPATVMNIPVLSSPVTDAVDVIPELLEPPVKPSTTQAPVGPLELPSLPNSLATPDLKRDSLPGPDDLAANTTQPTTVPDEDEAVVEHTVETVVLPTASLDAGPADSNAGFKAPVGPLELLALPNSLANSLVSHTVSALESLRSDIGYALEGVIESGVSLVESIKDEPPVQSQGSKAPVGPLELLALPNSLAILHLQSVPSSGLTGVTVDNIETVSESTAAGLAAADAVPNGVSISKSPVGPLELLALPNCLAMVRNGSTAASQLDGLVVERVVALAEIPQASPETELELDVSTPEVHDVYDDSSSHGSGSGHVNGYTNGSATSPSANGTTSAMAVSVEGLNGVCEAERQPQTPLKRRKSEVDDQSVKRRKAGAEKQPQPVKRRKSVRFSTTVESNTFTHTDPPSPNRSIVAPKLNGNGTAEVTPVVQLAEDAVVVQKGVTVETVEAQLPQELASVQAETTASEPKQDDTVVIQNKEHLQLSPEEAFFLSFGVGALTVLDPVTQQPIPQQDLLTLFRSHSYFPPTHHLQPDDPFLVHYAVYHHFRSLGWVPRHGIKFGVDWMIYQRGPVFDHAEFGAMVMPAYSDPWWKAQGRQPAKKSWSWLHGVNRVLSHVLKSLVLVYVDVPTPDVFDAAIKEGGIAAALKTYKVREFMVRRWSSNRNR